MTYPTYTIPPRIRSFVTRVRHLSNAQQRALEKLGPKFKLPYTDARLDYKVIFGRDAPLVLEIGCGMGTTTVDIATQRTRDNFLGIEVYEPGIGSLLKLIDSRQLSNIRVIQHDAVEVIDHMLTRDSLDGVHIFFPDPWHKVRHHKRRLIQLPFIKLLASRLRTGGYLHLATDWQNYAEQMLRVLYAEPTLVNVSSRKNGYVLRPDYRPITKFERRGLRLGHSVWDLLFTKCPASLVSG
ncbi:tRNA (guanosine(46)-N7)-methyltransferase TrmB [Candidatus Vallotia lariciata]|uniref:tRNA (guanosine(46)-N7)-methyltransferase TrmB n=1 Tax=Candidatus Vallotia laricis TaxID=2018052 RepID=UPI001D02FE88|nr:tRNA (guanosine(46)-N7)-methyltransferase TrmB [Candidatus Vallotia lariciata]UDG83240.1 tRNA (guanine-N(7)-)-methyltransferase [Candidatus Vallotia lariciata]